MLSACLAISLHALPGHWNDVHPCLRYERANWSVGAFYNSERRVSAVVGYTFRKDDLWLEIGASTGYSAAPVVPYFRIGYRQFFAMPAYSIDAHRAGVVVGVEVPLWKLR